MGGGPNDEVVVFTASVCGCSCSLWSLSLSDSVSFSSSLEDSCGALYVPLPDASGVAILCGGCGGGRGFCESVDFHQPSPAGFCLGATSALLA